MPLSSLIPRLSSFILLVAVLGCGGAPNEKVVKVRGKVLNDGQPLTVAGEEVGLGYVQIQFFPIDAAGKVGTDPESARIGKDGSYSLAGKDGNGIKPGKYRVVVRQWDPYPTDKLGGKFDETNSKIERDIQDATNIDLDLAKEG